jgi:hypothetical protein
MPSILRLALIAVAHIAFLVGASGFGIFKFALLPYPMADVIYFGVSTIAAGIAYGAVLDKVASLASFTRSTFAAFLASLASLSVGVALAFNFFGA